MKYIYQVLTSISPLLIFFACTKNSNPPGVASLTIVNAVNGSNPLITNFTPINPKGRAENSLQYYSSANQVSYANSWEGSYGGPTSLSLSQTSDTMTSIFNGTFNLMIGSIYTLFISGDTAHVDTLFTIDHIPNYAATDSVAGIRFVNLTQGSLPMTVNIQGNLATQAEFVNLGYRELSAFKSYPASSTNGGVYNFEIRDQGTGSVLTTYPWNYATFRNQTIVIAGSVDPLNSYPINIFEVNNY